MSRLLFFALVILMYCNCQNNSKSTNIDFLNFRFESVNANKFDLWSYKNNSKVVIDSLNDNLAVQLNQKGYITSFPIYRKGYVGDSIVIEFDYSIAGKDSIVLFQLLFLDIMSLSEAIQNPIKLGTTNSSWKNYSLKFTNKKDFSAVFLSFYNVSKESVKIDNIKLFVDGQNVNETMRNISNSEKETLMRSIYKLNLKKNSIDKDQFNFLSKYIKNKDLISLGESTHGTKEIFLIKNQIIQYLVENEGFNTLIFEGNKGDLDAANHFLLNDTIFGVDSAILKVFKCYQTEEIRELFQWIQKYNQDKFPEKQLLLTGSDVQNDVEPFKKLLRFASKYDSEFRKLLKRYREEYKVPELLELIQSMKNRLIDFQGKVGDIQYNDLLKNIMLIEQFVRYDAGMKSRDYFMAKNIANILNSNQKRKAIFWSHNEHANKGKKGRTGFFLADSFQVKQFIIGFALNSGDYRARTTTSEYISGNQLQRINSNTYEFLLESINVDVYFLHLGDIAEILAFTDERSFRTIGHTISTTDFKPCDMLDAFDAIIYINETTSATGLINKE